MILFWSSLRPPPPNNATSHKCLGLFLFFYKIWFVSHTHVLQVSLPPVHIKLCSSRRKLPPLYIKRQALWVLWVLVAALTAPLPTLSPKKCLIIFWVRAKLPSAHCCKSSIITTSSPLVSLPLKKCMHAHALLRLLIPWSLGAS